MKAERTFSLTSQQFTGEVILQFDEDGYLVMYNSSGAQLNQAQMKWLIGEMPKTVDEIERILGTSKTAKLTEFTEEVTFQMFWDRYDDKMRSSKKRAIAKWNKMSKTDQIKSYRFISRYEGNILPGTAKKFVETYLNAELWNN